MHLSLSIPALPDDTPGAVRWWSQCPGRIGRTAPEAVVMVTRGHIQQPRKTVIGKAGPLSPVQPAGQSITRTTNASGRRLDSASKHAKTVPTASRPLAGAARSGEVFTTREAPRLFSLALARGLAGTWDANDSCDWKRAGQTRI